MRHIMICLLIVALNAGAQEKGFIGDFTRSPTEHIILDIEQPFVVRRVEGSVHLGNDALERPLPNVLIEIQGPGNDKRIRHTTTDAHGRFRIRSVPAGTYRFKTTLNGYQSVMGTIVLSRKAGNSKILITMPVGV